jgi:DNA-directed RNA polymerase subunit M/transcription elongation factor TFIIS
MKMNTCLQLSIVLAVLILFSIDPETSLVAEYVHKQNYKDIVVSDGKFDKRKTNYKIQNGEHLCPKCESHSSSFQALNTCEGQQIQLISCKTCDFEWQETWTLPNWFWIRSSSPDNHWTSERWNKV